MTNPNTGETIEMARPELLEGADRVGHQLAGLDDQSEPVELVRMIHRLTADLDRCADYGQRLWQQLQLVTKYLREDVARALLPVGGGGLADEDAMQRWAAVYGGSLRLLSGPRGDSGYGDQQAQLELQHLQVS